MIRVVMFDLGQTLIDTHNQPFDHVRKALTAIASFKTTDGKPLRSCLVSDFALATPLVTSKKVRELFQQYLELLDASGLRPWFEPVQRRVTLSTHAGAMKPDRAAFETALRRLRIDATLDECLLLTENAAHIKAARNELHMQALRFRAAGSSQYDFDNWSQAPALIAQLVAPLQESNSHAAIKVHLAAKGIEVSSVKRTAAANTFKASGQMWFPVSMPGVAAVDGVHVSLPVEGNITQGSKGVLRSSIPAPTTEQISEAAAYVGSLAAHGQIASPGKAVHAAGVTHEVVVDESGQRRLVRKRFSAL